MVSIELVDCVRGKVVQRMLVLGGETLQRSAQLIEAGAPLVPCYHFGTADVFSLASPPKRVAEKLSRKFRISLIWPAGVLGLPVPRPAPLLVAVGRAVSVKQSAAPSVEQIDETHAAFVRSLTEAFDEHKHLAPGYETSELVVI